jgi:glycogen phosphorylase
MRPVCTFHVSPCLPAGVEGLREIAYNVRWAWSHEAIDLFRRLDSDLWEASGHNPVVMLGSIDQSRLKAAAADDAFLAHLERVLGELAAAKSEKTGWYRRTYAASDRMQVAYFSAEFGLTECLSIFAGGLGILAGDHLKSASDLGIPLVGIGLLYQQGYFRQYLNQGGWQQEDYSSNDFANLPVTLLSDEQGMPVKVSVAFPGREVTAQIWKVEVGRTMLYLLDTNIDANQSADRDITDQLYGGDREMRIKQEILLGIGGYRALQRLGIECDVFHMNEGHSAFLGIERIRHLMQKHGLTFGEARELASPSLVFTTHTPVEAGHDYFTADLIYRYFADYLRPMGLSVDDFLGFGRKDPNNRDESFCMTVLAMKLAAFRNGVSKLHAQVSRQMWNVLWPGVPEKEVPITDITNGVHFRSWISAEMNQLYDRYLGPNWREEPADCTLWRRVDSIPAQELWGTHERRRERLVSFARRRLAWQLLRRGAPPSEVEAAEEVLDPQILTLGFARRFATYKRATLLLHDTARLARILNHPERPVQIIFAGKAHPLDNPGKELIQKIVSVARQPEFRNRIVFLEDYDMAVARALVQGVDVWLNTPLRPLEASGTSGMKAAANGALNLSTLDGWWDEAWKLSDDHANKIGWAIGRGEIYPDRQYQDQVEAEALYEMLERDVVPAFYERNHDRLPRKWIARMKATLSVLCCRFNTHRMVREYTERFYLVAHAKFADLEADGGQRAKALAQWLAHVRAEWAQVGVQSLVCAHLPSVKVGERISIQSAVRLSSLTPDDVCVELYLGRLDARGEIADATAHRMEFASRDGSGMSIFEARNVLCQQSGLQGYTVRVSPNHPDITSAFWSGLVKWPGE